LLPFLPGFTHKRRLLYKTPVGEILQAFIIDSSGHTKDKVVVHCFVLPLYVPDKYVSLNFGFRMRDPRTNSEAWDLNDIDVALHHMATAMQREGVRFLDPVHTPGDFVAYAARTWEGVRTEHMLESLGYSQIRIGAYHDATKSLTEGQAQLDRSVDWQRETSDRLHLMLQYLSSGAFDRAQLQLESWRRYTMTALGVS
jgi:hypothetical protein